MLSPAHETLAAALQESPDLALRLLRTLGYSVPDGPLRPIDSNRRFFAPAELRPDSLATGDDVPWMAIEVQRGDDPDKPRRWVLLVALLFDQKGPGDLIVITHRRAIAETARAIVVRVGKLGTTITLEPVVVVLGESEARTLLDSGDPRLALLAAWSMHDRRGKRARAIVRGALDLAATLPEGEREAHTQAILNLSHPAMRSSLQETAVDFTKIPEGPLVTLLKNEGRVEGRLEGRLEGRIEGRLEAKRETLRMLAEAAAITLSPKDAQRIAACMKTATLDRWILNARVAKTAEDVFRE